MKLNLNIKSLTTCIEKVWKQNGHKILSGGVVVGIVATTGFAIADTVKAVKKVEEKKPETKAEIIKTAASCYIRTGVSMGLTLACAFKVKHDYMQTIGSMATALSISETARKEYEQATKEVVGEEKEQEIRDKIAEKQLQQNKFTGYVNREVFVEEPDTVRCYEPISKRYFLSNKHTITQTAVESNAQMIGDMHMGFVEWLENLGLPVSFEEREDYEDLGWNIDNLIDIEFSSQLCTDGVPALVIYYKNKPETEYTHWCRFG